MTDRIGRLELRDLAVPLTLVFLLALVPGVGFAAVFAGWGFVWVPVLGGLAGIGAIALAIHRRLLVGESLAVAIGLLLVVGSVAVGGFTPAGALAFLRGLITGWAELLTSFTPVSPTTSMLALPFLLSWFAALVGGELLRGTRVPALPALGPLVAFATSLLFTVEDRRLALVQGVVMIGGTLALGLAQQRRYRTLEDDLTTGSTDRWNLRGLVSAGVVLSIVVVAAPLAGPQLLDDTERFDLRQFLVPPFDPLAIPSPLTTIKGDLRGDAAEEVVFEVESPDQLDRWPIAVLGAYDGVVWTVAESASADAGRYTRIDEFYPGPPDGDLNGDIGEVTATVTITELDGHWLPRPGWVTATRFDDEEEDVRFNEVTGNVALPQRVRPELTYEVRAIPIPVTVPDQQLEVPRAGVDAANLPPAIRNLVADMVQGEDAGWGQIRTVADRFSQEGFYDTSEQTRPGHSLFRLSEFLGDRNRIVGFEEQYAAAAAVLVRSLERPARVVVGYQIPPERWIDTRAEVQAGDISAWIEIRSTGGWIALDVTPDRSREPDAEERGTSVEDVAIPNPPPPPPPPPDLDEQEQDELEAADIDALDDDALAASGIPRIVFIAAAGIGSPLLLLLALAVLVAVLRARRRERRRNAPEVADRVTGAWYELLDRCRDFGLRRPPSATTREAAMLLAERGAGEPASVVALAERVDRAAFHPAPPAEHDAEEAWEIADQVTAALVAAQPRWTRLRDRIDLRSILRRDPLQRAGDSHGETATDPDAANSRQEEADG